MMGLEAFVVQPFSIPLGEVTISALISPDQSNNWEVTVVISRAPDQEPLQGSEVDAQLLNSSGTTLKLLKHPSGTLVEAGGSLGSSVNAEFEFQNSKDLPTQLLVTYQGQTVQFQVVPAQEN